VKASSEQTLPMLLKSFRLPTFAREYAVVATQAAKEGVTHEAYLLALARQEASERAQRRVERLLWDSRLPREKTLDNFKLQRLPAKVRSSFAALRDGSFLDAATNVLLFGNPGTGKSHLVCALGQELARSRRTILFTPTFQLVQRLLAAKRDLRLSAELKKLDRFEGLILDDIGYVQQSREEMEVLFTLLAERYERRSVLITTNLLFSQWDQIFKDPMTTAAAIDRVVHHSVVLELDIESYRAEEAKARIGAQEAGPKNQKGGTERTVLRG
jgi:DNA replication protein DnaC